MDRHSIRYIFEHRILPQEFFNNKMGFVGVLLDDSNVLFDLISSIFEKEGVDNPYSKEDFGFSVSRIIDGVWMVRIGFPDPEEEPLCYCAYIFFDDKFEKLGYFCIEKGNAASDFAPFVCEWTSDGMHLNHGNCSFDEHDDFLRCADIYMEKIGGQQDEV